MRIAILSDIHGNRIALELCLSVAKDLNCDKVICLGDIVGYYPDGVICYEILRKNNVHCLLGNHEAMLLGLSDIPQENIDVYNLEATKALLFGDNLVGLKSCIPFYKNVIDDNQMLFVHGSPWDPLNGYIYPGTDTDGFEALGFDIIFCGHTHRPFINIRNQKLLVNVGSCGLPRDNGGLCSFGVYDTLNRAAQIVRVPIDVESVRKTYPKIHDKINQCLDRKESAFGTIVYGRGY